MWKKFMVCLLLLLTISTGVASAKFVLVKEQSGSLKDSWKTIVFEAVGEPLKIRLKRNIMGRKGMSLQAHYKKEKIYDEDLPLLTGQSIRQIQDQISWRYLFIIGNDTEQYLMGYDPEVREWRNYSSNHTFPSAFGGNTLSSIYMITDGQLILRHCNYAMTRVHDYRIFWDARAKWIGYEDLGVSVL